MGSSKPKPVQAPFQQQETKANTFGRFSVADSPEAKSFLDVPLNFGSGYTDLRTDVDLDPGVGHRTALAEQQVNNQYDSAFSGGIPAWIRNMNRARDIREVQGQGANEAQQAEYGRQTARRGLEFQKAQLMENAKQAGAMADLERKRLLLPQYLQTGGSGSSSGYNTQITQPQGGFLSSLGQGLGAGLGGAIPFI